MKITRKQIKMVAEIVKGLISTEDIRRILNNEEPLYVSNNDETYTAILIVETVATILNKEKVISSKKELKEKILANVNPENLKLIKKFFEVKEITFKKNTTKIKAILTDKKEKKSKPETKAIKSKVVENKSSQEKSTINTKPVEGINKNINKTAHKLLDLVKNTKDLKNIISEKNINKLIESISNSKTNKKYESKFTSKSIIDMNKDSFVKNITAIQNEIDTSFDDILSVL